MLNTAELEKRWFRYKIKSYIPHVSIILSLLVIFFISLSFLSTSEVIKNPKKITSTIEQIQQTIQKPSTLIIATKAPIMKKTVTQVVTPPIAMQKEPITEYTSHNKVQLSPSLDFMKKMQNAVQPYYKNEQHNLAPVKVQAPKIEIVKQEEVHVQQVKKKSENAKITIQRKNTQNDIFEIIARFKKNSNPALSLFVAKKYYELGDYEQSYNYALITNKINKNIESSWIIFTKSLLKLGKRKKAIAILKRYIKQSNSSSAQILLDEIYAGKFK